MKDLLPASAHTLIVSKDNYLNTTRTYDLSFKTDSGDWFYVNSSLVRQNGDNYEITLPDDTWIRLHSYHYYKTESVRYFTQVIGLVNLSRLFKTSLDEKFYEDLFDAEEWREWRKDGGTPEDFAHNQPVTEQAVS
jgi:hypothetical protein